MNDKIDFDSGDISKDNLFAIIVLCELIWNGHSYSDFYGVEWVRDVVRMRYKVNVPVVFVSFATRNIILQRHPNFDIISTFGLGHSFCQLPDLVFDLPKSYGEPNDKRSVSIIEFLNNRKNLSSLQMSDLRHYYDPVHMVQRIRHDSYSDLPNSIIKLKALLSTFNQFQLLNGLDGNINIDTFVVICNKAETCITVSNNAILHRPVHVLLLDDEYDSDTAILSFLAFLKKGDSNIQVTSCFTPKEALKVLNNCKGKDSANSITVILCDLRIKEPSKNGTSPLLISDEQGYDFLSAAAAIGGPYKYVLLSSLPRDFKTEVANYSKQKIHAFGAKESLIDVESQKRLRDLILDLSDDIDIESYERVFTKETIKQFYFQWKNDITRYNNRKNEVDRLAIQIINKFLCEYKNTSETSLISLGIIPPGKYERNGNHESMLFQLTANFDSSLSENEIIQKRIGIIFRNTKKLRSLDTRGLQYEENKKEIRGRIFSDPNIEALDQLITDCYQVKTHNLKNFYKSGQVLYNDNGAEIYRDLSQDEINALLKLSVQRTKKDVYKEQRDMDVFVNRLVARRFAIFLYYILQNSFALCNKVGLNESIRRAFTPSAIVRVLMTKGYIVDGNEYTFDGMITNNLWLLFSSNGGKKQKHEYNHICMTREEADFMEICINILKDHESAA